MKISRKELNSIYKEIKEEYDELSVFEALNLAVQVQLYDLLSEHLIEVKFDFKMNKQELEKYRKIKKTSKLSKSLEPVLEVIEFLFDKADESDSEAVFMNSTLVKDYIESNTSLKTNIFNIGRVLTYLKHTKADQGSGNNKKRGYYLVKRSLD